MWPVSGGAQAVSPDPVQMDSVRGVSSATRPVPLQSTLLAPQGTVKSSGRDGAGLKGHSQKSSLASPSEVRGLLFGDV